jgi:protein SCO1/2
MPNKNRTVITVIGLLAFVSLFAGFFISQKVQKKSIDVQQFHGTFLDKPRVVQPFSLIGTDSVPFNNASLKGHWTMIFFGFTNCGSICPTTMAELGKMYRLLEKKGVKKLPNVVMISVDPERDNLDKLSHYVKAFDPHFYGAQGDDDTINAITKELGVAYAKINLPHEEDSENYDIEHTGTIMLFNPKGELNAFFTTPHYASLLAKDYVLLVS